MRYNVQLYVMRREIEQTSEDRAVARVTAEAWYRVSQETNPKRSIVLLSAERDEFEPPGPHKYRILFRFEVDAIEARKSQNKSQSPTHKEIESGDTAL